MRGGGWALLALVLVPAFGTEPVWADCPPPAAEIAEGAMALAAQALSVVEPDVPPPAPSPAGRRTPNGGYRTRHGFAIAPGCFTGGTTPESIESTITTLLNRASSCARTRLPGYTHALFNGVLHDGATITCRSGECAGETTGACYFQDAAGRHRVNFPPARGHLGTSGTWFHELLHAAGADNQCVNRHNATGLSFDARAQDDEVYFWEAACFQPEVILAAMRAGDRAICSRALHNHSSRPNRVRHHLESIKRTCRFFLNYLTDESALITDARERLYPEVFSCGAGTPACPPLDSLNTALVAAGEASRALPTPTTLAAWANEQCHLSAGSGSAEQPWSPLYTCMTRLESHLEERLQGLRTKVGDGGLTEAQVSAYERYFRSILRGSKVLADLTDLDRIVRRAGSGAASSHITELITECRAEGGAGSAFCQRFETDTVPRLAGLMARWQ
ncbi:MAG: hypothetical protein IT285_05000 [Bdellovibrionales bacterium]|nr:hypothetical protein [Bdellovibrionales bacterium]